MNDSSNAKQSPLPKAVIDCHIHLAGTGCGASGCWVSPRFKKRYTFRFIRWMMKISQQQMNTTVDSDWVERISRLVHESSIDYGVILGFDGVYDHSAGRQDENRTQMVVPTSWVGTCAGKYQNLLPGPSVNPHRRDALDALDEAIANKAVLIKWLPATQAIDPAAPGLDAFYKKLAAAQIPLLIHMGGERTFAEIAPEYNNVDLLRPALDLGVKIICAHSATAILMADEPDQIPRLLELMEIYPNLYVDNSGLLNPSRFQHLKRLVEQPLLMQRSIYGSDYPVPSNSFYFPRLGLKAIRSLEAMKNPLQRDFKTKQLLGYPEFTETNSHQVLGNLQHWLRPTAATLES